MMTATFAVQMMLLASAAAPRAAAVPAAPEVVAEVHALRFQSGFLMNLHHTLYAAAWARRPEAGTLRALAGALPSRLDADMSADERRAWTAAIDYYDRELASRDLLFNRGLGAIMRALSAGTVDDAAVPAGLRAVLNAAAPVYRRWFWSTHDRANRAWIGAAVEKLRTVGPDVIRRLEAMYGRPWLSSPVPVDVVWVGNRQGAYTHLEPTHVTISSGDADNGGWASVETVFHEVSHELVLPLQDALATGLGERARDHRTLWHVVQFYLTGSAVQQVLRGRGVDYQPYLYSTGLFERAWPQYRKAVEAAWQPFVDGKTTRDAAIAETVKMLGG